MGLPLSSCLRRSRRGRQAVLSPLLRRGERMKTRASQNLRKRLEFRFIVEHKARNSFQIQIPFKGFLRLFSFRQNPGDPPITFHRIFFPRGLRLFFGNFCRHPFHPRVQIRAAMRPRLFPFCEAD